MTSDAFRREDSASTRAGDAWLLAAPAAALVAGAAAQWLDFRELRYPLLMLVGAGVLATAATLTAGKDLRQASLASIALGMVTWGAAETFYVLLHIASGERFDAPRFGAQPMQALGLIGVHALALGAPTGVAAAAVLAVMRRLRP